MTKSEREQIINELKDWKYNLCVGCEDDNCNTCVAQLLGKSLSLINKLTNENKYIKDVTAGKIRDKLRDISEFNLKADDNGALYYIDLQAWMEEIELGILLEDQ